MNRILERVMSSAWSSQKGVIVVDMVAVQNLLAPFLCVLGERHFTEFFFGWWSW